MLLTVLGPTVPTLLSTTSPAPGSCPARPATLHQPRPPIGPAATTRAVIGPAAAPV